MNKQEVTLYLDYLDKEMTIMGILSAFCLAVVALVVDKVILSDSDKPGQIWESWPDYIIFGCGLMLFSGYLFYRQRSLLAYYYGQICLALCGAEDANLERNLHNVDAWATWISYNVAFTCMFFSIIEYFMAIISSKEKFCNHDQLPWAICATLCALVIGFGQAIVLYSSEDEEPFIECIKNPSGVRRTFIKLWLKL